MDDHDLNKSEQTWSSIDIDLVRRVSWCSIDYFQLKIKEQFIDDKDGVFAVFGLLKRNFPDELGCMSGAAVVCGDMQTEKQFFEPVEHGIKFISIDGYDISKPSMDKYTPPPGVTFNTTAMDCNDLVLPYRKYNLVIGSHGIHHVYNLGNLFYQVNKSLKPNGLLYMYEWIGPEYLQVPFINKLVSLIIIYMFYPLRRHRRTHMGTLKGINFIHSKTDAYDPSEACNSTEIYPQFRKYFKVLKAVKHGGLTYPIFESMAQNLNHDKLSNKIKFRIIYFLESMLTSLRIIKPLFVAAIGEKK